MTREEAINELKCAIDLIKQDGKDWLDERDIPVLNMAIEALDKPLPKPHERLMYWETARRIIDSPRSKSQMLAVLDSVPPVEAIERKCGKWINTRPSDMSDNIVCSECGYDSIADYLFCPNCGARMCDGND